MVTDMLSREVTKELIAVGAAIASNCEPCLEYHVGRAREIGVADDDILRAVQIARAVKEAPARNVARLAGDLLCGGAPLAAVEAPAESSPCRRGAEAAGPGAAGPGCSGA